MADNTELKPCPFCDGPATVKESYWPPNSATWIYWVECEDCGATGPTEGDQAEAEATWNTRPSSTAATAQPYAGLIKERIAAQRRIEELEREVVRLREGVRESVDATRDYIVPDGISGDEAMHRIIGALDNPNINPFILEMDRGQADN